MKRTWDVIEMPGIAKGTLYPQTFSVECCARASHCDAPVLESDDQSNTKRLLKLFFHSVNIMMTQ